MEGNCFFTVTDFPRDIYTAVGEIIRNSQEWEAEFKEFVGMQHVLDGKIEKSSLNKLNEALKKNGKISDKEYENLRQVITYRNYINHTFFLEENFHQPLRDVEKELNYIQDMIFEARDMIGNKTDKARGIPFSRRPTVFDEEDKER